MKPPHGILRISLWIISQSLLAGLLAPVVPPAFAAKVTAHEGQLTLPTYGWAAVKHPYFRGTDKVNIYPYPMLDFLSREATNRTYRTVILENEYLRITFLPELGGKIHEVIDKSTGQPMFYVNHVIKPGLIGQCGAWTSGGVEWNTGPQGHTVSCLQPIEVRILESEKDGSRSVAIGETERIYGTKWTVVVALRPGRSFIEERIRIYNPTETIRPYYFWNCTAVPNTAGFRFIYPMTLGCDHAGENFFEWPLDHGKDLTRGSNYQDASSIFAWYCDQDFFGSYNDDLGRGVVAYANHHQLPGKKAWTWGHGSFGTMHQMDLTDKDGPYNEVQTGPLLTQAQVGRLDPCEAVEWNEWWYPIHGLGGFTFANKELAANASVEAGEMRLQLLGTGDWGDVSIIVGKVSQPVKKGACKLSPRQVSEVRLPLGSDHEPFIVTIQTADRLLARFRMPLDLPARTPPEKKQSPHTAAEIVQAGWQDFLFARFAEAEAQFRKALEQKPTNPEAQTGLAYLNLDRDPQAAATAARAALKIDPDHGKARFALSVAEYRLGHESVSLEEAWHAALDPGVAIAARALVAKLLIRAEDFSGAIAALTAPGPWREDPLCRNLLAFALARSIPSATRAANIRDVVEHVPPAARALAEANLKVDPLDLIAERALAGSSRPATGYRNVEYLAFHSELAPTTDHEMFRQLCFEDPAPYRIEMLRPLQAALAAHPNDGQAALRLGHLLFHLGRYAEGRELWKRAAELGAEPVIAYRALGMAAKTLDSDLKAAREWLEKASQAAPGDAIVARDLSRVLFELADKCSRSAEQRQLVTQARARLKAAFTQGKGRSDFVALLARAQNRLEEFAETARMLDAVRVTIWEGAHEVHDLFEEAHLALGEAQLKAGHPSEALAEFNRALEYPANLATGKLENGPEAHIQYQRGNALIALGRKEEALAAWKLAANEPESKEERLQKAREQAKEALRRISSP